jgi:hypothetical protein
MVQSAQFLVYCSWFTILRFWELKACDSITPPKRFAVANKMMIVEASSCSPLSLPPLHVAPPRTTAYCHCACAELQNTMTDATPTASNVSCIASNNR